MNVIWAQSPLATSEVIERLPSTKRWKLTTVKTFLDRLVQKGALDFEIRAGRYFYRPKVSREICVKSESSSFLSRVFSGESAPMLVQFVKSAKLSTTQIRELKDILAQKESAHGNN